MFFMNSTSACAGSFFAVAVYFVIQASILCFGGSGYCALYQNLYCSMNLLKAFKVACRNWSWLNCKFCIPHGVVAASSFTLYPCRHILIRSYNERKTTTRSKEKQFLFFHTSLLQVKKYCFSCSSNTSPFLPPCSRSCISSDYSYWLLIITSLSGNKTINASPLLSENSTNHPLYCNMIPCLFQMSFVFFLPVCIFLLLYYTFCFFTPSKGSSAVMETMFSWLIMVTHGYLMVMLLYSILMVKNVTIVQRKHG